MNNIGPHLQAKIDDWDKHPKEKLGELLYALNYPGQIQLYYLAPREIRSYYDRVAISLTSDILHAAALVLIVEQESWLKRILRLFSRHQ